MVFKSKSKVVSGFSIIELIVVIVVIGILTTIGIVSYVSITRRTHLTVLQTDLSGAITQLEKYNTDNSTYPDSLTDMNDGDGLNVSDDITVDYEYYSYDNTYCLNGTNHGLSYYVSSNNHKSREGTCPKNTVTFSWGGSSASDYGKSVVKTTDGGYVVTGQSGYGGGSGDMFIAKYTSDGTKAWAKTWGGTSNDVGNAIIQTSDGGYAVTGSTNSFGSSAPSFSDMFLAKFTADGSKSWIKTWGGDNSDAGYSLVQTPDGGYAVTGLTISTGYTTGGEDAFVARFTADGDISWLRTWGDTAHDEALDMIQVIDGGYVIVGNTYSYGADGPNAFIAKFDSNGILVWSKTLVGSGLESGVSIVQAPDGSLAFTGSTLNSGVGTGGYEAYVVKTDNDGNLIWKRSWGGSDDDSSISISNTSEGNFVITGGTKSYGSYSGTKELFVVEFDASDGDNLLSATFGGVSDDYANSIIEGSYGGYAVTGYTKSYNDTANGDMLFVKVASDGTIAGCTAANCGVHTVSSGVCNLTYSNQSSVTNNTYSVSSTNQASGMVDQTGTTTDIFTAQFQ